MCTVRVDRPNTTELCTDMLSHIVGCGGHHFYKKTELVYPNHVRYLLVAVHSLNPYVIMHFVVEIQNDVGCLLLCCSRRQSCPGNVFPEKVCARQAAELKDELRSRVTGFTRSDGGRGMYIDAL
jgi:hypothetical protein